MRKRVVIGVATLGVFGVYLLWPPSIGSVEWHKQRYVECGYGSADRWVETHAPSLYRLWFGARVAQLAFHYEALTNIGYFEERVFVLSNRFPEPIHSPYPSLDLEPYLTNVNHRLTHIVRFGSNTVTIRAGQDEMKEVEKAVRRFDVPVRKEE